MAQPLRGVRQFFFIFFNWRFTCQRDERCGAAGLSRGSHWAHRNSAPSPACGAAVLGPLGAAGAGSPGLKPGRTQGGPHPAGECEKDGDRADPDAAPPPAAG